MVQYVRSEVNKMNSFPLNAPIMAVEVHINVSKRIAPLTLTLGPHIVVVHAGPWNGGSVGEASSTCRFRLILIPCLDKRMVFPTSGPNIFCQKGRFLDFDRCSSISLTVLMTLFRYMLSVCFPECLVLRHFVRPFAVKECQTRCQRHCRAVS